MRKMGASMAEARGHEKTPQKRKDRLSFCPAQLEKRARAMTEPEERQSSDWSMLGLVRALHKRLRSARDGAAQREHAPLHNECPV